jgi:hypothetical protein
MPPRHLRLRGFRHQAPGQSPAIRCLRAASVLSAAVVAAAVATSITLNHPDSASAGVTRNAAVLDVAIARPPADPPGKPAKPLVSATPAAPASTQPAAPASTQPAAPKPPAAKELGFEFQLQPNYYYCGPSATAMALSAHGTRVSVDTLASELGTTVNGTDSAHDTTRVLNSVLGTNVYHTTSIPKQNATAAETDKLRADVVHAISNGYGVVANIAGYTTDTAGVRHNFPGGHYIAIVGYLDDGNTVKIADSSGMFGPGTYWVSTSNTANWIGTRGYSA